MTSSERYLDAAATAPLRPEALAAMLAVLEAGPANPSSVHAPGHRARAVVEGSRDTIAAALGARSNEVIFTSGGTEANNLAIVGLALANPRGRHIVTTPIEHPSVLECCEFLERVFGFEITLLPVDAQGIVHTSSLEAVMRDDTTLVSVGLANAEIGTVQPVTALAAVARARGALMHTDAVQAAASLPVSFSSEVGSGWPGAVVDAMTIASHKFGGPQGAGALLVRSRLVLEPVLRGGGQERGLRSGTHNVPAIAGFAAAVRATADGIGAHALEFVRSRDELIARVLGEVPGAQLTGDAAERLPGHASFVVAGQSGESMLVALDAAGFAVSSGSACAAGEDEPSPALLALGMEPVLAQTAIRFTLAAPLAPPEIARIATVLRREVVGR